MLPVAAANMLSAPFFREVFIGLNQAMQHAGRHLLSLFGSGGDLSRPGGVGLWESKMRLVDSLIAFEVFNEQLIVQAGRLYPVVSMDARVDAPGVSSIVFDHKASIRMAFKHLVDLGHRRIGFVGRTEGYADPAVAERINAYRGAFDWMSKQRDPRWEFSAEAQSNPRALAGRWLRQPAAVRPTALIVVDLFWTLAPIWLDAGVRIPGDLSLVNVGVVHIWSDHLYHAWHSTRSGPWEAVPRQGVMPPFANQPANLALIRPTTIELPSMEMGTRAVGEVLRRLHDPSAPPGRMVLEPRAVHGNTTSAPSQSE
jgi:DNA-binding LacI/PurR family transcriptional regulator